MAQTKITVHHFHGDADDYKGAKGETTVNQEIRESSVDRHIEAIANIFEGSIDVRGTNDHRLALESLIGLTPTRKVTVQGATRTEV